MHPEMLTRIHTSHTGIESSICKVKEALFWPRMSEEFKDTVQNCETGCEFSASQQTQPLMTPELPRLPWSKVALDVLTFHGRDYLVTVDYFSDYFELDLLEDTTSASIIAILKQHFARHGVQRSCQTMLQI